MTGAPLLARQQHDELRLRPLDAMDRADRDAVVGGGVDLLGVESCGVVEETGERGVLVLLLEGLGGPAE
jgi:hypothetical protein